MKPYAPSCDENKDVILSVIKAYLADKKTVLEIASGTGQHAVFFAQALKHLNWQSSDLKNQMAGMQQWIDEAQLSNLQKPIELDVSAHWPNKHYDAIFSANAIHIMSHQQVEDCFNGLGQVLEPQAICLFYGPFNYEGAYTSDSNKRFDVWLKNNNPLSCIKDFEWIVELANRQALSLLNDHKMPANNRILVFIKN